MRSDYDIRIKTDPNNWSKIQPQDSNSDLRPEFDIQTLIQLTNLEFRIWNLTPTLEVLNQNLFFLGGAGRAGRADRG